MTDQTYFETSTFFETPTFDRGKNRAEAALLRDEKRKRQSLRSLRREELQLREMITTLDHAVISLDLSIAAELDVARERNPSHCAYPIWATALSGRRDNLKATIAVLSERLTTVERSISQLQV
jgi:hypothetical protein